MLKYGWRLHLFAEVLMYGDYYFHSITVTEYCIADLLLPPSTVVVLVSVDFNCLASSK